MQKILVAFAAGVSALLFTDSAMTQEGTTASDAQYAAAEPVVPGPDAECPGAKVVNTTTGTGDKQSPPFNITGGRFRVTVTVVAISSDPDLAGVSVYVVNDENNDTVTRIAKEGPGTESSVVNAGPGRFYLDLITANADYAITVEDLR
jgi:hypothetical protein